METFLAILCSSAVAAVINGIFTLVNTLAKNKCLAICKKNTELEAENAALKQQNSDLNNIIQEYQKKDADEFKAQITTQTHQTEANSSYFDWND